MGTGGRGGVQLGAPRTLRFRRAAFDDVAQLTRLISESIETGCRDHYGPEQRRAVFLSYAQRLFVESLQPLDSLLAIRTSDGAVVGFGQVDPQDERLRALFVSGSAQGTGVGRQLLRRMESQARARGCRILHGAMSLSAVPFYASLGYRASAGPTRLVLTGVVVPVLPMTKRLAG